MAAGHKFYFLHKRPFWLHTMTMNEHDLSLFKEPRVLNYLLFPYWPGYPTGILLKSFDIAQLETGITKSFPSVTVFNIWLTQLCTHARQYGTFVSDNSDLCLVLPAFLSCLNSCLACIILLLVSPCQLVPTCLPLFDLFLCIWEKNVHSTEELIEICMNPRCFRAWLSTERFLFCFKDFLYGGAQFSRKFLIKLKFFR